MYSRCSHCQTLLNITTEQLRSSRGLVECSQCGKRFDALLTLSDQVDSKLTSEKTDVFLQIGPERDSQNGLYLMGSLLSLLILIVQIYYFEGDSLKRQPQLHAGLMEVCNRLGCRAPAYKNLDEWSVSHSDLQSLANRNYVFSAAITNQALFPQTYPDIKLALLNFNGQVVAERIFSWRQFSKTESLAASETAAINLRVVAPNLPAKIGGYTFTLL